MIKKLSIKNFKSIINLDIECSRINLFIGEPNTGKSNILEVFGLLSWCEYTNRKLKDYVRIQNTQNLFYDDLIDQTVEIDVENDIPRQLKIKFQWDAFRLIGTDFDGKEKEFLILDYSGNINKNYPIALKLSFIKFFRFLKQTNYPNKESSFLLPPYGSNLFAVVMGNTTLRETMAKFFHNFSFNLVLRPQERTFEVQKQIKDVVISYPYLLTSDTLQRIIFHIIAIESNANSTLIFEEPESQAFPYYTKYLGEKIAFNNTNQYFITTHNPYLLLSILEKAEKDSVKVFITYFREYQTKVRQLTNDQISELMDADPFFNLNYFIEEEEAR